MTQQPTGDQELFPQGTVEPEYSLNDVLDTDAAGVYADITDEDRAHWMRARAFVQEAVADIEKSGWTQEKQDLLVGDELSDSIEGSST